MKKRWEKIKKFFGRPKVIKWTIAMVTLVIVTGILKLTVWSIYTKDEPDFVPEEVRRDIQGAIKDGGEAIKKVSEPVGNAIVDSVYKDDDVVTDPTANWPTYTDAKTGISMKYPEGWQVFQGENGTFSFLPDENSYSGITVYVSANDDVKNYWQRYVDNWDADISGPEYKKIGSQHFTIYKQNDGMRENHYLLEVNNTVYDILPGGEGHNYIEEALGSIN